VVVSAQHDNIMTQNINARRPGFNVQATFKLQASTGLISEATVLATLTVCYNIAAWKTHQGAGGEGREPWVT